MRRTVLLFIILYIIPTIAMHNNTEKTMFSEDWYKTIVKQMVNTCQEEARITNKEFNICIQNHCSEFMLFLLRKATYLAMQELNIDTNNFSDEHTYMPITDLKKLISIFGKNLILADLLTNPNIKNRVNQILIREKTLISKLKNEEIKRLAQLNKTNELL